MKLTRNKIWKNGLALTAAAGLAVALIIVVGQGGQSEIGYPVVSGRLGQVATAQATLRAELRSEHLTVVDVACVKNGRSYQGHLIVRCNVNFGDPHVEAYCTVVSGNRMVTNYEDPSIPCRADWSGWKVITFSSSGKSG